MERETLGMSLTSSCYLAEVGKIIHRHGKTIMSAGHDNCVKIFSKVIVHHE